MIVDDTTSLFLFGRAEAIVQAITTEFCAAGLKDTRAVIAGFGDVGKAAYQELLSAGATATVIDSGPYDLQDQVVGNAEDEQVPQRQPGSGAPSSASSPLTTMMSTSSPR